MRESKAFVPFELPELKLRFSFIIFVEIAFGYGSSTSDTTKQKPACFPPKHKKNAEKSASNLAEREQQDASIKNRMKRTANRKNFSTRNVNAENSEQTMKMVGAMIGAVRMKRRTLAASETESAQWNAPKKFQRKLQAHVMHARRYRFVL